MGTEAPRTLRRFHADESEHWIGVADAYEECAEGVFKGLLYNDSGIALIEIIDEPKKQLYTSREAVKRRVIKKLGFRQINAKLISDPDNDHHNIIAYSINPLSESEIEQIKERYF